MRRAFALLVLVIAAAGCGGSEPSGKPAAATLLAPTVRSTEQAESYVAEFTMRSTVPNEEIDMAGRMTTAADGTAFKMTAEYAEAGGKGQEMIMRSVGDTGYVRGEIVSDLVPPGKRWVRMTEEYLAAPTMTPSEFLGFLRDSEDVEEVGREDVRGRSAVHLRGPVDLRRALKNSPDSPMIERFRDHPALDDVRMNVDVWITEDDDRVARMVVNVAVAGTKGSADMTTDILDYDVPLDIERPPADQVVDMSELAGG